MSWPLLEVYILDDYSRPNVIITIVIGCGAIYASLCPFIPTKIKDGLLNLRYRGVGYEYQHRTVRRRVQR